MDTLGRVKMQCWKSQYQTLRKLPCSSSMFSFEIKRKPISRPFSFVSPPCSPSMSPEVDEKQSNSAILSTALSESESDSVLVHVRFVLQKECVFGERFYLVGDNPLLGLWDPSNGIPLDWSDDHVWSAQFDLLRDMKIEFKFVLLDLSGEVQWQPGPNRVLSLYQVITSSNWQAGTITVWEDWETADNQTVLLDDVVVLSGDASVMQDPDCNGAIPDVSNKTGVHPESTQGSVTTAAAIATTKSLVPNSTQGNVYSGIISGTGLEDSICDSKSNSKEVILVPRLNSESPDAQEADCIETLEIGDENHYPVKEVNIEGHEDESYERKDGAGLKNISSEKEILEPTTASVLQNDLQLGQRALQDTFPATTNILRNDLHWSQRVLQGIISSLGFDI